MSFTPDADLRRSVSIDVIFAYSEKAVEQLNQIDALQWPEFKRVLGLIYGSDVASVNWDLVPGTFFKSTELPDNHQAALLVVAFANYPDREYSKLDLTDLVAPRLVIDSKQIALQSDDR